MKKFKSIEELRKHLEQEIAKLRESAKPEPLTSQEIYDGFDTIDLIEMVLGKKLQVKNT